MNRDSRFDQLQSRVQSMVWHGSYIDVQVACRHPLGPVMIGSAAPCLPPLAAPISESVRILMVSLLRLNFLAFLFI